MPRDMRKKSDSSSRSAIVAPCEHLTSSATISSEGMTLMSAVLDRMADRHNCSASVRCASRGTSMRPLNSTDAPRGPLPGPPATSRMSCEDVASGATWRSCVRRSMKSAGSAATAKASIDARAPGSRMPTSSPRRHRDVATAVPAYEPSHSTLSDSWCSEEAPLPTTEYACVTDASGPATRTVVRELHNEDVFSGSSSPLWSSSMKICEMSSEARPSTSTQSRGCDSEVDDSEEEPDDVTWTTWTDAVASPVSDTTTASANPAALSAAHGAEPSAELGLARSRSSSGGAAARISANRAATSAGASRIDPA
mmetsp:Transcript_16744/g.67557  ORF Transcript_16744/g.67557 Transcript_16744/m.67557 type:complete len:310 (+) Transcript_16744:490-1419(+)